MKSEKLKKLEIELRELKQWCELGLFPEKELDNHKKEISSIEEKIDEEKRRLLFIKENDEIEDYAIPKRSAQKHLYDHQPMVDMDGGGEINDSDIGVDESYLEDVSHDSVFDVDSSGDEGSGSDHENEEDPYSDRNRWKRSMEINNPETDEW